MLLDADLDHAEVLLGGQQSADDEWVERREVVDEFARNAAQLHADVRPRARALHRQPVGLARLSELSLQTTGVRHTAQHSTAQHSTTQHNTAQHSTAQHSTSQHSTA